MNKQDQKLKNHKKCARHKNLQKNITHLKQKFTKAKII